MNVAGKIRENRLTRFGPVERRIYDIVNKIREIIVEENEEKIKLKKKWIEVFGEDMKACEVK